MLRLPLSAAHHGSTRPALTENSSNCLSHVIGGLAGGSHADQGAYMKTGATVGCYITRFYPVYHPMMLVHYSNDQIPANC